MNIRRGWQRATEAGGGLHVVLAAISMMFSFGILTLLVGTANAANDSPPYKSLTPTYNPHANYSAASDQCATCHRTHGDNRESFTQVSATSHSVDCLSCHDGTGATTNVSAEYTAVAGTPNVPSTRSYYTHDALAVNTGHQAASSDDEGGSVAADEFMGRSNRHSDCVDCHNPHAAATAPESVQMTSSGNPIGWSMSGALQSVSAVAVNGGKSFVGHATTAGNLEYQLCMKCHSSYTVLGTNNPSSPSRDWFDKAAEINPATAGNGSMHPVMAMGTNHTETMTANLAGTSAYKRWTFTDSETVRCTNCHANGPGTGTAGQGMPVHASPNRGMLILPYQDRVLLTSTDTASTARFALCFACHSDVPFKSASKAQRTAFDLHYDHMANFKSKNTPTPGTSIDTAGAGSGYPLCAECHFRLHSSINKFGTQNITGSRLVNFAPNVTANGGTLRWTPRNGATQGTCVLVCHGFAHNATY